MGRALAGQWRKDRVTGLAAEVAFFTMLAIFPALLAVAAVLGSLDSVAGRELAAQAESTILAALDRVFTNEADGVLDTVRGMFGEQRTGILTLGALGALFAAARGFLGVVRALDVAYDLDERRSWFQLLPTAVVLAVGSVVVAALMLAMLVLGPVLGGGREVAGAIGLGDVFATFWDFLRAPSAFVALVLWAAIIYWRGPDHKTTWRSHLPGALLAASFWLVVSLGFRLYLLVAAQGNQVFGVLGGAMTLLVWLYLLGIGLLLGGELNAILAQRRQR
ncbi:MAG: YihY/virulence factor BrkB family protein [Acidimicrobiales bacterium]